MVVKTLAEGKGETVRFGLKEAGVQSYEPTNGAKGTLPNGANLSAISMVLPRWKCA